MRRLACFLAVVVLMSSCLVAFAAEPGRPLSSVQGDFIQQTHLKILTRPLISHGTFAFQAPQSLRWEYDAPLHSVMLMHNGTTEKLIERNGKLVPDTGMGAGSLQVILPQIGNWLSGRITDNAAFTVKRLDQRTLVLTPKDKGLRSVISVIRLHLGKAAGMMESVTIVEGPDASTTLTFNHVVLNRKIPESTFTRR